MTTAPEHPLATFVSDRLKALKTSPRAASLAVGENPDLIRNLLRMPAGSHPRTDTLAKVAQALGVPVEDLLRYLPEAQPRSAIPSEVAFKSAEVGPGLDRSNMIEVRGTAMGSIISEGVDGFQFDGGTLGYTRRPRTLLTVPDAYAIIVTGDSMVPMHNPGETRVVNPRRPVAPGDTVIAVTQHWDSDPGQAYIKILRRRTPTAVFLEQFNPPVVLEIPTRYVVGLHYVLTYDDLIG